jgi:hypothetical protein
MSFMLTERQIQDGTKDVTRRLGWWFLKPGDVLWACFKCMGLKKGEKVQRIRQIRVVSTRTERLDAITQEEVVREGLPWLTPVEFVEMFCEHMACFPETQINRIEFEYIDG